MIGSLRVPVIAAPMAGGPSTPALAAAVSDAGGLGFLAAGYLTAEALGSQIDEFRKLTDAPFGVNLFLGAGTPERDLSAYVRRLQPEAERYGATLGTPDWADDDHYPAKLDLLVGRPVPVVSFTFGCPAAEDVRRLQAVGTEVLITVTTPAEAATATAAGADALVVQGFEAGGHRGAFIDQQDLPGGGPLYGLLAALRLIAGTTDLPLIAAGGLVHGADIAAVLAGGAVAAQLGTAFLRCPEAGTQPAQRKALAAADRDTDLTRAFSGRPARGLVNRFMDENSAEAPSAYPQIHQITRPLRAAAAKQQDPEAMSLWAGQTYSLAPELPAAELIARLTAECGDALLKATRRIGM
ncbi:nitronate monooxygenase [Pseudonocardiaceae bacterium YIM PH 21723]|nr:nitronate monooxygenase [Pseudonocardiaceae bacterium YIM PH 21723]